MKERSRHIRYFLFSQYLSDGIRITIQIILPALVFSQLGALSIGLTISTGALCVSISDAPGPVKHKRNGMLYCSAFVVLMTVLTGFANGYMLLLELLLLTATFFFTMLTVFGNRAASVGIAALLIMVLRMDKVLPVPDVLLDALWILCGALWYTSTALLFYSFTPYRQAQRALGNCIHETAEFLHIKSSLYHPATDIQHEYRRLLAQQVVVNERQDEVRELLFKSDALLQDNNTNAIVFTFSEVSDLYEKTMATWYDYSLLRDKLASSGILEKVSAVIKFMAVELDNIGLAIQSNLAYTPQFDINEELEELKRIIDLAYDADKGNLVLKKILVNFRNLHARIVEIARYFESSSEHGRVKRSKNEYAKFVTHQEISLAVFRDNLNTGSSVFRHSLRMTITGMTGFAIARLLLNGHHSYWILLTILFILKPGYSLTRERNLQRIAGTIAGGLLGILIITTVKDHGFLFGLIVFFMLGTYTFQRMNYIVMVFFTTPYILILFHFLGMGALDIARDRIMDTAIASLLAFFSSYLLFPHWESKQFNIYIEAVLEAHNRYLHKLKDVFSGIVVSTLEYKLVRKDLYVSMANFSAAARRMLSEPKSKQQNVPEISAFEILSHVLASNVASLFEERIETGGSPASKESIRLLNRSMNTMEESIRRINKEYQPPINYAGNSMALPSNNPSDDLKEHLAFVYKITTDINKVVHKINFNSSKV